MTDIINKTELDEDINYLDNTTLFKYVVIFIGIVWLFSLQNIKINILVGIIIGYFLIKTMNNKRKDVITQDVIEKKNKKESIYPRLKDSEKYQDIVDTIFDIKYFYNYSPLQYKNAIKNLDMFFNLYDATLNDNKLCYVNYKTMVQLKRNTLNDLSSIILGLPIELTTILTSNISKLDEIMTNYLNKISYIADDYLYKNGYDINTKIIDYDEKASNEYLDMFQPYSYEIY